MREVTETRPRVRDRRERRETASVRGISVHSIKTDNSMMANFDRSYDKTRLENETSSKAK